LQTLMYPDFKHMLRHFSPAAATPTPDNTMSHDALADSGEIGVEVRSLPSVIHVPQAFC